MELSCRAIDAHALHRNDIYEVLVVQQHGWRPLLMWKTSVEFSNFHLALAQQSPSSSSPPPPPPGLGACQPSAFQLGGGSAFRHHTARTYQYLLNWACKHQPASLLDFLGLPVEEEEDEQAAPEACSSSASEVVARATTPTDVCFVALCLVCIGLSSVAETRQADGDALAAAEPVAAPDAAWGLLALQVACFASMQLEMMVKSRPAAEVEEEEVSIVVDVGEEGRNAAIAFAMQEITLLAVEEDDEEEESEDNEEEEEEEVKVLMSGTLFVEVAEEKKKKKEEEVIADMPEMEPVVLLKSGELSFESDESEYEYEYDCSSVWTDEQEEEAGLDSEESTDLSDCAQDDEDDEPYAPLRPRTNWGNYCAEKADFLLHSSDAEEEEEKEKDDADGGVAAWFSSQDVATKVAVGAASAMLVASVAMRFKRWARV